MISTFNENVGWVYIAEQTSPENYEIKNLEVYNKNGIFYVEFDACLHSFDVMNRNQRMYEGDNVWECILAERIQYYLSHNGWFGEMNHPIPIYKNQPLSPERINDIAPGNTSHKMINPHIVKNLLLAKIQSDAGTEAGENLAKKMVQGYIPGFSCRAIARLMLKNNKPIVNVKKIITYDWVLYPSHREAEQLKDTTSKFINKTVNVINESVNDSYSTYGDVMVPLKEIFEGVGRSDYNVQCVMEAFELTEDDIIGFTPNRKQMVLSDNTNTIYCNINFDSYNKVNNFMRSLKR